MTVYRSATLSGGGVDLAFTNRELIGGRSESHLQDLAGFFGGVGIDGEKTQRTLGHGLFEAVSRRTGRSLTLKAYLHFENERDRLIADRLVSGLLWEGEYGELTVATDEVELSCRMQLDGEISHAYHGVHGVDLSVPLIAPDPFLYAPVRTYQVYPEGAGVGLRFPLFGDADNPGVLSFGKANPNTRAVVQNEGNATEWPVIRVVGDLPSGFTLRDSAGRTLNYPSPVRQNTPVEVDSRSGAVYQNGIDQTYRLTRREWFSIPPGGTNSFTISSPQDGDGYAEVQHRSTYI